MEMASNIAEQMHENEDTKLLCDIFARVNDTVVN